MNKILLIRPREIGDVVFTTPAVHAVRRRFPDARITYVVEPRAFPVVAENPDVDEVIVTEVGHGVGRLRADIQLARRMRARRFDLVIDFHGGARASWLTWATGAPMRIGYAMPGRQWHYTIRVARPRMLRARHSVVNQWDLLLPLDIEPPTRGDNPTVMVENHAARTRIDGRLAGTGVRPGDPLVVLHVSAGNAFRRWPLASFAELIVRLAERDRSRRFLVTSGPSEEEARKTVMQAARERLGPSGRESVVDVGELDLQELHAVIGRAALFVGPDSGPLHIASTTTVPIVGLYGPTLSDRSAPWRNPVYPVESVETAGLPCRPCEQEVCEPGDFRCLVHLAPALVAEAAERAMGAGALLRMATRGLH